MKNQSAFSIVPMKWPALLAGMLCLLLSAAASAEQGARPCAEDAARLCKGVEKGGGRIAKCLKEHENELSSACKDHMAEMKEKARNMKDACKADAQKLCKDVKPGGGRIMQCLKQHEGELSAECKEKMTHPRGRM